MRPRDLARATAHNRAKRGAGVEAVGEGVKKEHEKERPAKKTGRRSFAGVQQFDGFEPVIHWPADPVKDASYPHQPLQAPSHLWADLITASSADERRGNARKGG